MNLTDLKTKPVPELVDMAREIGLENLARLRKQEVIAAILRRVAKNGEDIYGEGVLEILQDGFGFLRSPGSSYLAGPDDIYVSPSQIRRFSLRTGDSISGKIRPPKDREHFALLKVDQINMGEPNNRTIQDPVRKPHCAVPGRAFPARTRQRQYRGPDRTHHRPDRAPGEGPTWPHRVSAQGRQDHHSPECRPVHLREQSRGHRHRPADRRTPGRSHRHGADRGRRGGCGKYLRRTALTPCPGRRNGDREGQAPGGAQEGRGHPAGLHHPPGPRIQHHRPVLRARC